MLNVTAKSDAAVEVSPDARGILEYVADYVNVAVKIALVSIAVRDGPVPVCAGLKKHLVMPL